MHEHVCVLIGLANTQGVDHLSLDGDELPHDLLWVSAGWFSTAVMVWREYESLT